MSSRRSTSRRIKCPRVKGSGGNLEGHARSQRYTHKYGVYFLFCKSSGQQEEVLIFAVTKGMGSRYKAFYWNGEAASGVRLRV